MNCEACGKELPGEKHVFSGYGFRVGYCPEHCPGEVDGSECGQDHPNAVAWKGEVVGINPIEDLNAMNRYCEANIGIDGPSYVEVQQQHHKAAILAELEENRLMSDDDSEEIIADPNWETAGGPHDWKKYVPESVRSAWGELDELGRLAVYLTAQIVAGNEHWD